MCSDELEGGYVGAPTGLSDHDGQIIQLDNISMQTQSNDTRIIRNFSKEYIHDFQSKLSYESWDTIFGENNVDKIFNNFHNIVLRIFYSSFPKRTIQVQKKKDCVWMTKGLKTSISHKRELYLISRDSRNPKLKQNYKSYCKALSKVIKEAKILHYNKQILTSHNKTKTVWNIVKTETGKKLRKEEVASLKINGELIHNQQVISNSFNDYFLNTAEKLMTANQIDQLNQIKNGAP